ncbi:MAG: CheR family methyltransferase [Mariprofundaceae bacterium]|nr:CheR family methyltransferase [Mariprofundaceae bacterium]
MQIPKALLQCLHDRLGLNPTSINTQSLINGISQRMKACRCDDIQRYAQIVQNDRHEFLHLVEVIVVTETSFFRHPAAFQHLRQLAQQHGTDSPLRILCLPSSTGEEPYSVAMCLLQAGLAPETFSVDAVDVSSEALMRAQAGLFQQYSFRGAMVQSYMHYFSVTAQGYRIAPEVQQCVRFHQANILNDSRLLAMGRYPIIFCRNLMIYLHADARLEAAKTLTRMLEEGGTLFSGNAENSAVWHGYFQSQRIAMTFAMSHADPLTSTHRFAITPYQKPARPASVPPVTKSVAAVSPHYTLASVQQAANQGNTTAVIRQCEALLQRQPHTSELYFYLALAHESQGRATEAVKKLRQAVYLQPHYQDALQHLALLLDAQGELQAAQRVRQRLVTVREHGSN